MFDLVSKNPIYSAIAAVLVISGGVYAYRYRAPPPSSDEFFRKNPHLSRPVSRMNAEELPARNSDEFLPEDFHLVEGKAFPIQFQRSTSMTTSGKVIFDSVVSGTVVLHSLGLKERRLTFIAEFRMNKVTESAKLSPRVSAQLGLKDSAKRGENLLLVRMDPSGKVIEMAAITDDQEEAALEIKVNAILGIFRRVPSLRAGTLERSEADDRGNSFPIRYQVSSLSGDSLKILGESIVAQKFGGNAKKSAAAGLPNLEMIGLENDQKQSFDWIWNLKTGLPTQQSALAEAAIRQLGQDLARTRASVKATWSPSTASTFKDSDKARFKVVLNFRQYAGMSVDRMNDLRKMSKKAGTAKTWETFNRISDVLKDPAMTDEKRDELFVDFARALRDDPSRIEQVKSLGMKSQPGSRETSMALGALGFEGSPEAQAAMVDIYSRPGATEDEKQKVLTEFALSPTVLSPATKTFLVSTFQQGSPVVSDTAASAGLAIGSSISKDGDPVMVKVLQKEWDASTGLFTDKNDRENMQTYLLTAMGNSKSDVFLNEVKSAAKSSNEDVRSAAVNSVRFAQDPVSRAILVDALKSDASMDVRITAAQSLRYQPYDLLTQRAIDECTGSPNLGVKIECYRVLTSQIDQPGVRPLLEARLSSESDPQVKGLISSALSVKAESKK